MKPIGLYEFPTTREEASLWKPTIQRHALDRTVLAVAKTRIEGAWAAYIKGVEGQNHQAEQEDVLYNGTKLSETLALQLFPNYKDIPYAP